MKTLAYWAFANLPAPMLRRVVTGGAFLRSLLCLVRRSRVKAQVIEGARAGVTLRVLWVGDGAYREYLLPRLFPKGFAVLESLGVRTAMRLTACGEPGGQCDMIAVERNRLLPVLAGFRRIPPQVRLGLDFQQRQDLSANARHRRDQARNRVLAAGIEFRDYPVRKAPEMLWRFYRELYVPHISTQFGSQHVEPFEAMRTYYVRGLLRLGFQGEIMIAGTLFMLENRTLVFCKSGVRNLDDPVHRAAASIFLQLDYAEAHGYHNYDAFHARPFFEDGVFAYKRGCGLDVRAERWPVYWDEDLFLRIMCHSPGILDFLRHEPHLRLCEDGSLAACLCPAGDGDLIRAVAEVYLRCRTHGIGQYEFLVPRVPSAAEEVAVREECGQSAASLIFKVYDTMKNK